MKLLSWKNMLSALNRNEDPGSRALSPEVLASRPQSMQQAEDYLPGRTVKSCDSYESLFPPLHFTSLEPDYL